MVAGSSSPFAELLKHLRAAAGFTQGELAERAGVSARAISDLERGLKLRPHADTVERLSRALELEQEELVRFQTAARGPGVPSLPSQELVVEVRPVDWRANAVSLAGDMSDSPPQRLPPPLTSFVGREEELAGVKDALRRDDVRLLTLTGPGGTGKTRLALQAAAELSASFPDGCCFVSLAAIPEPDLVIPAIAAALGLQEHGRQALIAILRDNLREKDMLLLLDNFEHLLEASMVVGDLLARCLRLKILVTSRAVLHLTAEHIYAVPALSIPDSTELFAPDSLARYDAVTLFLARATAARADFVLTSENASAVVDICRQLDGLPLALELAAARIRLFPPQALLPRLSSRLGLLTVGARDLPDRQQTLYRTMEWSYALLDAGDRRLFRRLAVFAGGCTLEAVESVCNADLDLDVVQGVASLLDQSLLSPVEVTGDEPRLNILETIREYALQRLRETGESEDQHRRHADYYLALAELAEPGLRGAPQTAWLLRLEQEHNNFRAALRWCIEAEDAMRGLRLGGALWRFWYVHSHFTEGRQWLNALLALPDAGEPTFARARALNGAGNLAYSQGDFAPAQSLHQESLMLRRQLDDQPGVAASLNNLALLAREQGDYESAGRFLQEAIDLSRTLGLPTIEALALGNLGTVFSRQEAYDDARPMHAQALALFTAAGDDWGRAMALCDLASVAYRQQDFVEARARYEESCVLRRQVGDRRGLAASLAGLGAVLLSQGEFEPAQALLTESLDLWDAVGDVSGTLDGLEGVATLAAATGQIVQAVQLAGAAAALRRTHDLVGAGLRESPLAKHTDVGHVMERGRLELDETAYGDVLRDAAAPSLAQALSLARQILGAIP